MNKMWMMGYNDGNDFNLGDPFSSSNGRRLRQLIPRPTPLPSTSTACSSNNISSMSDLQCLSRIHGTHDLFALNHHLGVTEQSKRDFSAQQVVISSRWNPTPEQLQTLEELYRRGTRTPNADEIQHITAQLRRYGKIEGKNVFYWFQNHKARERQKRRRQLETVTERKDSGGVNKTGGDEVEQTKNWGIPTNCTSTFSEKCVWIEGATKAECRGAEVGWLLFEEAENTTSTTTIGNFAGRNATWHTNPSSPHTPPPLTTTTNFLNTCYTNSPTTTITTSSTTNPSIVRAPSFIDKSHETLQLFPLGSSGSSGGNTSIKDDEMGFSAAARSNHLNQLGSLPFFEFLPLKN